MKIAICKPVSPRHQKAARWMSSMVQTLQRNPSEEPIGMKNLQNALEIFAAFTQTGDEEYRHLSNRFLGFALAGQ